MHLFFFFFFKHFAATVRLASLFLFCPSKTRQTESAEQTHENIDKDHVVKGNVASFAGAHFIVLVHPPISIFTIPISIRCTKSFTSNKRIYRLFAYEHFVFIASPQVFVCWARPIQFSRFSTLVFDFGVRQSWFASSSSRANSSLQFVSSTRKTIVDFSIWRRFNASLLDRPFRCIVSLSCAFSPYLCLYPGPSPSQSQRLTYTPPPLRQRSNLAQAHLVSLAGQRIIEIRLKNLGCTFERIALIQIHLHFYTFFSFQVSHILCVALCKFNELTKLVITHSSIVSFDFKNVLFILFAGRLIALTTNRLSGDVSAAFS